MIWSLDGVMNQVKPPCRAIRVPVTLTLLVVVQFWPVGVVLGAWAGVGVGVAVGGVPVGVGVEGVPVGVGVGVGVEGVPVGVGVGVGLGV
jgi:hypothetical protein